jgi:hypothetical protein
MARVFAAGVSLLLAATSAAAAPLDTRPTITPLERSDREQLEHQRQMIATLARRHVGSPISGGSLSDLRIIQQLLDRLPPRDRRLVPFVEPGFPGRSRIYEVQALGVALGDVMARNLRLEWVVFEDAYGRGRALNKPGTKDLVFPVTMISKRYEKSIPVDVRALYDEIAAERAKADEPRKRGR